MNTCSRGNRSFARLIIVSLCLLSVTTILVPAGAQKSNQKRPRRVSSGETQTAGQDKSSGSSGDDVEEGDVVRVDTQLVSVPAVVTSNSGRVVAGLKAENFLLLEDGRPQTITNFATTEAPFEVALLLDTSGSTRADVALIRQAANVFIDALRPGDRVALLAFDTKRNGSSRVATVQVLATLTENRKTLRAAMEDLGSSNGTPFYDALEEVADNIFREPPREEVRGRRALVALTDGVDSTSESDFAVARTRLVRSGASCYFIQVNTEDFVEDRLLKDCEDDGRLTLSDRQLQRYRRVFVPRGKPEDYVDFCKMGQFERMQISRDLYNLARREMNDLAKATGGKNFVASSLQDARAAFARVATEIGTQYSLGYYPTNKARDGKYRTIRVEVRGVSDKPEVRAREGYYAPKN